MDLEVPHNGESRPARAVLSQRHLETIFNAAHDVVLVLDGEQQHILHVNQTVEYILGYRPEELAGVPFSRLAVEEDPVALHEAELVDGVYGPVQLRCADDSVLMADVTVTVIPWDGHPALLYTVRDVTQRARLEEERERLVQELQEALNTVKQLSGLLPICANCKRIRNEDGSWASLEHYISTHSDAEFSHGICPVCREELYPGVGQR